MTSSLVGEAVNIRPGVGIIGLFPHMNYKPWFALGELVDNAIGSFLQHRDALARAEPGYRCRIEIEVSGTDGGRIRVADNAGGIGVQDFARAFVSAEPPPDPTGLSQFGMGMKSASCWFAKRWQVTTSALGEDVTRRVAFDVPDIVEHGVEEIQVDQRAAPAHHHFTELVLWDLHKPPQGRTIGKMAQHLASMYRIFLASGDVEIVFNGTPLAYEQPAILVAPAHDDPGGDAVAWRKPIEFTLPTGERVSGFAGIRERGSVAQAGFSLFRNDRLIMGSVDETYRPHEIFGSSNSYRFQRVFGELHLQGFDVSHTKDGFIWGEREQELTELLRQRLDAAPLPLLQQAEHWRSKAPTPSQREAGTAALESTAKAVERSSAQLSEQLEAEPDDRPLPEDQPPAADLERRALQAVIGGQAWDIVIELSSDPGLTDWLSIADASPAANRPRHLDIRVSLAHPFMLQFGGTSADGLEPLLRVAAGLALSEVTAREAGVSLAGTIRRNLNDLLRGSLSQP